MGTCPRCSKQFESKPRKIYCSSICQKKAKAKRSGARRHHKKYFTVECALCHKIKQNVDRNQKYCSRECASLSKKKYLSIPDCLENASRKLDKNIGYVRVYCPSHPKANTWGYVYEHRLVAEGMIGRYLAKNEHVHHINGKRWDNRPENLEVLNASDHAKRTHSDIKNRSIKR